MAFVLPEVAMVFLFEEEAIGGIMETSEMAFGGTLVVPMGM